MRFFIDSADLNEIQSAFSLGFVSGVTMNPVLMANQNIKDPWEHAREVEKSLPQFSHLSFQPPDFRDFPWHPTRSSELAIKVAMTSANLPVFMRLKRIPGVKINATCIFTQAQALAAAALGAHYVSFFWARMNDQNKSAGAVVKATREVFVNNKISTKIIAGSIRGTGDAVNAISAGADIVTATLATLKALCNSDAAAKTLAQFDEAADSLIQPDPKSDVPALTQ